MYGGEIEEAAAGHAGAGVYAEDTVLLDTGRLHATEHDVVSVVLCCVVSGLGLQEWSTEWVSFQSGHYSWNV